jgi:eukaryotic-like serine/threonine-protein kinase
MESRSRPSMTRPSIDDGVSATIPPAGDPEVADEELEPYAAGDVIGAKYRLGSVLGEGGMGAVWAAQNLVLGTEVAVKLIRRDAATPQAHRRLLREARATASIDHPSIVRIYDYGETERGDPFIVMEALRGGSLAELFDRRKRLPAAYAVRVLLPIAGALAEAHERGVVHRDLKPDNVVLAQGEVLVPKVIDFGIAKLVGPEYPDRFTSTGAVLGSADYMSPEQARGRADVDERTDIWALCVVLYEAIAGRRPFDGDNYHALLNAIIEDVPVPTTHYAAGDAALWAILERGLSKSPEGRWPTMRTLGRALAAWAASQGVETDVTGRSLSVVWLRADPTPPGAGNAGVTSPGASPAGTAGRACADTLPLPRRRGPSSWTVLPAIALLALAGVALREDGGRQAPEPRLELAAPRPGIAPAPEPGTPLEPPPPKEPSLAPPAVADKPAPSAAKPAHRFMPVKRPPVRAMPLPPQPGF